MSSFSKNNRFHMERLEDRQMMAGDIEVIWAADGTNTLIVKEAEGHAGTAQSVMVSRTDNGFIKIEGKRNADGGVTLVNGKQYELFAQGFGLDFRLGGGSDFVHLENLQYGGDINIGVGKTGAVRDNDRVTVNNVQTHSSLNISTSGGQDFVHVTNTRVGEGNEYYTPDNLNIRTGVDTATGEADKDEVLVQNVEVLGDLNISTGASTDNVTIINSEFGHGYQRFHTAVIETGVGADAVSIDSIGVTGNFRVTTGLDTENERDTVTMSNAFVSENLTMYLGHGDDTLDMLNIRAANDIVLNGMKGNDTMTLTEVEAFDGFYAVMGDGNDTIDMTFVKAKLMYLDGGTGTNDRLFRRQMPSIPSQTIKGWESIDGKPVLQKVISPTIVVSDLPTLQRA
jgi:hypothetical protein